jgi:hypothetical protein
MTLPTLASAEGVVISWLLGLTTSLGGRVGTQLSGDTWPQCRVTRVGGTVNEDRWYDNPRVQVEFWGSSPQDTVTVSDDAIDQLARDVIAQVQGMRGAVGGGFISSAYVSIGPLPFPDPVTNRYRQLIEITLEVENP